MPASALPVHLYEPALLVSGTKNYFKTYTHFWGL